jgi:Domain of unknown function (DUF4367)
MDEIDDLLNRNRQPVPESFARTLRARLNSKETHVTKRILPRLALAGIATALAAAATFNVPALSAAAQGFLNLFRIQRVTAIAFDPTRIQAVREQGGTDVKALMGDAVEVIAQPGEPVVVADADAASLLSGIAVRLPASTPFGAAPELTVGGAGHVRVTGDSNKIAAALQVLGVTDVTAPAALDGATIDIKTAAAVVARYGERSRGMSLIQTRSPEVTLPEGVRMADLGEIGLRLMGMSADEARTTAAKIDWNSTLVVPIPANAATFREVTIGANTGLLIASEGRGRSVTDTRSGRMLVWVNNGIVYALTGDLSAIEMVTLAESL